MATTLPTTITGVPLRLSETKPDYYSIVLQLELYLQAKQTWQDLLTSSAGETLIEMIGAVGAFNQYGVESAAREGFLSTALRDSSIYAGTRMLGVRISRKIPSTCEATLTRAGTVTLPYLLPKFTQFTVDGTKFFNRAPVLFAANSATATCVLYQGEVRTQTIQADSTSFREINLNEPGFGVADTDVDVKLVNTSTGTSEQWIRTEDGVWMFGAYDTIYNDSTDGFGSPVLAFGDGYHGKLPSVGNNIVVTYAVTNGSLGNSGTAGLSVAVPALLNVTGTTTSSIKGGADQKKSSFYKVMAPRLYRARQRAVLLGDYRDIAASYPSAASSFVQAQRDLAPNDLRWMNKIQVCLLPQDSDDYSDSEWADFIAWFKNYYHAAVGIQRKKPTKRGATISLTLYINADAVPDSIKSTVTDNIQSLFEKRENTLGRKISKSDIYNAAHIDGVDYLDIDLPTDDFVPDSVYSWFSLESLTINVHYTDRQ